MKELWIFEKLGRERSLIATLEESVLVDLSGDEELMQIVRPHLLQKQPIPTSKRDENGITELLIDGYPIGPIVQALLSAGWRFVDTKRLKE